MSPLKSLSIFMLIAAVAALSACGQDAGASNPPTATTAKATATAVGTPTPSGPILLETTYSGAPEELQTRLGDFTVSQKFARVGDEVTVTFKVLASAGWLCGGQYQVAGGVREVSINIPPGDWLKSYSPETLDRDTARVTVAPSNESVDWNAGAPTDQPANCAPGDHGGQGADTGLFSAANGDEFSVTFEVGRGGSVWRQAKASAANEQGTGSAKIDLLDQDEGDYARLLDVSISDTDNGTISFTGQDWDPNAGDVTMYADDVSIGDYTPGQAFDGEHTFGANACGKVIEARQASYIRRVTLTCSQ